LIYLTKRFHFSASHRVFNPELSNEENFRKYGNCSNPNGHGHNYILEITITGELDSSLGYLIDLKEVKMIVEEKIISKVDHKNLNMDVDFMQGVIPSAENIAVQFWNQLEQFFNTRDCRLYSVRITETDNNIAEYKGNN
jgi:6-pyruvoyltetrahydropterin/6-carboxytetrahydropterin synthase